MVHCVYALLWSLSKSGLGHLDKWHDTVEQNMFRKSKYANTAPLFELINWKRWHNDENPRYAKYTVYITTEPHWATSYKCHKSVRLSQCI